MAASFSGAGPLGRQKSSCAARTRAGSTIAVSPTTGAEGGRRARSSRTSCSSVAASRVGAASWMSRTSNPLDSSFSRSPSPAQASPRHASRASARFEQPPQHEGDRLDLVERVVELGPLLERVGRQVRREQLLGRVPGGQPVQPGAERPEADRHRGRGQRRERPQRADPPAAKALIEVVRIRPLPRLQAGEGGPHRDRCQERALVARADHRDVRGLRRHPRHRLRGGDPHLDREPHPGGVGGERLRDRPLAEGEQVPQLPHVEEDALALGLHLRGEGIADVGERGRGRLGVGRGGGHDHEPARRHRARLADRQPSPHPRAARPLGQRDDAGSLASAVGQRYGLLPPLRIPPQDGLQREIGHVHARDAHLASQSACHSVSVGGANASSADTDPPTLRTTSARVSSPMSNGGASPLSPSGPAAPQRGRASCSVSAHAPSTPGSLRVATTRTAVPGGSARRRKRSQAAVATGRRDSPRSMTTSPNPPAAMIASAAASGLSEEGVSARCGAREAGRSSTCGARTQSRRSSGSPARSPAHGLKAPVPSTSATASPRRSAATSDVVRTAVQPLPRGPLSSLTAPFGQPPLRISSRAPIPVASRPRCSRASSSRAGRMWSRSRERR